MNSSVKLGISVTVVIRGAVSVVFIFGVLDAVDSEAVVELSEPATFEVSV